jgi:hypothetical protein
MKKDRAKNLMLLFLKTKLDKRKRNRKTGSKRMRKEKRFEAKTCEILFVFFREKKQKLSETDPVSLREAK